jgi:hypothetical protein
MVNLKIKHRILTIYLIISFKDNSNTTIIEEELNSDSEEELIHEQNNGTISSKY